MSGSSIYLDNNATTHVLPGVKEAVCDAMTFSVGNPSSVHQLGAAARRALEANREIVAEFIDAPPEKVIFVSGGTEANNTVISSFGRKCSAGRLVISSIEHSSVLQAANAMERAGIAVDYVSVDSNGQVDPAGLEDMLRKPADLVSIQWVNSETGVIQAIPELLEVCRERGIPFHTDAAQAVGKIPVSIEDTPVDFLTFTGHKLHAPAGIGAIYVSNPGCLHSIMYGGDHEFGKRPGTENMIGIAGLATAIAIRKKKFEDAVTHMRNLRDHFERRLLERIPDVIVNGARASRVCNTSNIRFPGIDGQALVAQLDRLGLCCSQTSACMAHKPQPSHVLRAMGLSENEAFSSVRFSFSVLNTIEEVERAIDLIQSIYSRLKKLMEI